MTHKELQALTTAAAKMGFEASGIGEVAGRLASTLLQKALEDEDIKQALQEQPVKN